MTSRVLLTCGVVGVLACVVAPAVPGDESEQGVGLESVPAAARSAAEKAVDGIKLEEAEVEAVLIYELKGSAAGKPVEIEVTSDGHVLLSDTEDADGDDQVREGEKSSDGANEGAESEKDEEGELEIPVSAVPEAVLAAARRAFAGFEATAATVEPALLYSLEGEADGAEYEIEVTADGHVVELEKDAQ